MYLVEISKIFKNYKCFISRTSNMLQVSKPIIHVRIFEVLNTCKLNPYIQSSKGGMSMTERLQDYYDYVESRRHNLAQEAENERTHRMQEQLTREQNVEAARAHQASEAIAREGNAIQQQANAWTYDVGSRNAGSNERQASVAEGNLGVNQRNANTQYIKAMADAATNNKNAVTNAKKVFYDNLNAREKLRIDKTIGKQNYEIALKNVANANARLDLAIREYELNKTDKYWNNVLKSVETFNHTADTWAAITGKKAPSTTIRVSRDETSKAKKWNGTITLRDIAQLMKTNR